MPNALNDSSIHYVKFMRGSISAWESLLTTPERISDDTLYFIYQNAQTSTDGKLYLGRKLISGTGDGTYTGDININDIGDVYIDDETLADKQILVYNETSEQWENTSLSTIINTAVGVMVGATSAAAGKAGLVPAPAAGDETKFLKGNGTWATIDIPIFDDNVFTKTAAHEITLAGFEDATLGMVPVKTNGGLEWVPRSSSSLTRIITTLEELNQSLENGSASDDVIYMIPNHQGMDSSNQYDEYMIIQQRVEHLGTFGNVNLDNYVTTPTFQTAINNLSNILNDVTNTQTGEVTPGLISRVTTIENNYLTQADIGDLSTLILTGSNTNLVQEINTINNEIDNLSEKLKWHELDAAI